MATDLGGQPNEDMLLDMRELSIDDRSSYLLKRIVLEHARAMSEDERATMCALARQDTPRVEPYSQLMLHRLRRLGLVYLDDDLGNVAVHPALRELFAAIDGVPAENLEECFFKMRLDLREQPGPASGQCARCLSPALIESVQCACCSEDMPLSGDEFLVEVDDKDVLATEDHRGNQQYIACENCEDCSECDSVGGSEVDVEFGEFCSYCEHMWQKLQDA